MFNDWLHQIRNEQDELYYDHLLLYSTEILKKSEIASAKDMATLLNLNAQQWSITKRLLLAYRRTNDRHD